MGSSSVEAVGIQMDSSNHDLQSGSEEQLVAPKVDILDAATSHVMRPSASYQVSVK